MTGSVTGFDCLQAGLPQGWVVGDKTWNDGNDGNDGKDVAGDIAVA